MAITTYGVGPTITAQKWAQLWGRGLDGGGGEYVSGFTPTVATGTRKISIAPGTAAAVGCLVESTTPIEVTLNNADQLRVDIICLEIDWTETDASTAGRIVVVEGASLGGSGVLPFLTREAGTLWQIPLAQVVLLPGIGQLGNDNFADYRPTRRQSKMYRPAVPNKNGNGRTLLVEQEIEYPGFDYRLRMSAAVNMAFTNNGFGEIEIANTFGSTLQSGRCADQNRAPAFATYTTGKQDAYTTVQLFMRPNGTGGDLQSFSSHSYFEIELEPF